MSFDPLFNAPVPVVVHVLAALLAVLLGPVALYRRRRDSVHKLTGYVWIGAMAVTALSSFLIHSFPVIGPFSPIHGLSLYALWSLFHGLRQIIVGEVARHARTMRELYWNGLAIAGILTLLPGRIVNRILFGGSEALAWAAILIGLLGLTLRAIRRRARISTL